MPTSTSRAPERFEHVGDPEAVADLEQLAAGDDHLASLGERRQREQHGGGVVVDGQRALRAGQPPEDRRDVILSRPARPGFEVVLEVRVAGGGVADTLDGGRRQRRPAQVRVHDHARRVQHAAQARPPGLVELVVQSLAEVARIHSGPDLLPCALDHEPGGVDRERVVGRARELVHRRKVSQLHGQSLGRRLIQGLTPSG